LWPYFRLSNSIPYGYTQEGITYDDEIDTEGRHHIYLHTEEGACEEGGEFKYYSHFNNTIYIFLYSYDVNAWESGRIFCTLELNSRELEFVSKDTEIPKIKVYYYWHPIPLYDR
jgi:hypothetical protein